MNNFNISNFGINNDIQYWSELLFVPFPLFKSSFTGPWAGNTTAVDNRDIVAGSAYLAAGTTHTSMSWLRTTSRSFVICTSMYIKGLAGSVTVWRSGKLWKNISDVHARARSIQASMKHAGTLMQDTSPSPMQWTGSWATSSIPNRQKWSLFPSTSRINSRFPIGMSPKPSSKRDWRRAKQRNARNKPSWSCTSLRPRQSHS